MTAKGNAGCWLVSAAHYTGPPVVPGPVNVVYVSDGAPPLLPRLNYHGPFFSCFPLMVAPHPAITAAALTMQPQPASAFVVNPQPAAPFAVGPQPAANFAMDTQSATAFAMNYRTAAQAIPSQPAPAVVAAQQLLSTSALPSTSTAAVGTAELPAGYSFLSQVDPQIRGNRLA